MATLFGLKLYWIVWLELPSSVTLGCLHPSALIVLKDKSSFISSILCISYNLLPLKAIVATQRLTQSKNPS